MKFLTNTAAHLPDGCKNMVYVRLDIVLMIADMCIVPHTEGK